MVQTIAEIGFNHGGYMSLAEKMITSAAKAGATFAKFQTWSVKRLKSGAWDQDGRRQIYEKAELSDQQHLELMKICNDNGIRFLTSVFSRVDAQRVARFCEAVKIPSAEITNVPMLEEIAQNFKTVYLSTGAATFSEIEIALRILGQNIHRKPFVFLLHCVSAYPCEFKNANLNRITTLNNMFGNTLPGYSGHCFGIDDALASLDYGVEVIEKHFTIDQDLPGRDNKFAILPHELEFLTKYIKNRAEMKNIHFTQYSECESDVRNNYRGRWDG
jgi:sialic acid synthase SpsE